MLCTNWNFIAASEWAGWLGVTQKRNGKTQLHLEGRNAKTRLHLEDRAQTVNTTHEHRNDPSDKNVCVK
jgi:hypothetical protein